MLHIMKIFVNAVAMFQGANQVQLPFASDCRLFEKEWSRSNPFASYRLSPFAHFAFRL